MPDDARMCRRSCSLAVLTLVLLCQSAHAEAISSASRTFAGAATGSAPPAAGSRAAPQGLTLAQAVGRFRRENLRLLAAEYEVSATRADIIAAGLLPNPRVSLDAYFHVHGQPNSAEREYAIQLSQALPLSGRLSESRDAAQLTASASEREFAAAGFQLLGELQRAYLSLQLAQAEHGVLLAGLADLESVERILEARAAAGANPEYDRLRLQLERGNLRARAAEAEARLSDARSNLSAAIGGTVESAELQAADAPVEPSLDERDPSLLARWALAHRHEIAATRLSTGAAEARLRAARRRVIPEPELGIGYARWSGIPGAEPGSSGGALLASASIPLPLFDHGQGTIDRQLELSRAARVRERDQRNSIEREVERAAHAARLSAAAYHRYRAESSHVADSVRRIAELTYREGRGTILELLDAYSSYLRVEEKALELRFVALSAALDLEQAMGPTAP